MGLKQSLPENGPVISERVEELLARMNLDEKIGQMTQVEKNSLPPGAVKRHFIGSVLSGGGGNPEKFRDLEMTILADLQNWLD